MALESPHDWETDPRPLATCLRAWHGREGWSRARAANELRIPISTYHGWCAGRFSPPEGPIRRLMTLVDHHLNPARNAGPER